MYSSIFTHFAAWSAIQRFCYTSYGRQEWTSTALLQSGRQIDGKIWCHMLPISSTPPLGTSLLLTFATFWITLHLSFPVCSNLKMQIYQLTFQTKARTNSRKLNLECVCVCKLSCMMWSTCVRINYLTHLYGLRSLHGAVRNGTGSSVICIYVSRSSVFDPVLACVHLVANIIS